MSSLPPKGAVTRKMPKEVILELEIQLWLLEYNPSGFLYMSPAMLRSPPENPTTGARALAGKQALGSHNCLCGMCVKLLR